MAASKNNSRISNYKRLQKSAKKRNRLNGNNRFNFGKIFKSSTALIFVVIFACLGFHFLFKGHAANNWEIKSAEPGDFCMELSGTELHDGAVIRTAPCDGREAEHFYWGGGPAGPGTAIHWDSNWCIQPQYGGTAPGTPIVLSVCQDYRPGQVWHIHDLPGTNFGEYRNDNAYGPNNQAMCLTIPSGNTGMQLSLRACGGTSDNGYLDQMWKQKTYDGNPSSGAGNCQNPLRAVNGLSAGRYDGGVDYGGSGPVYAACPGTIKEVYGAGWPGGIYIDQSISTGSTGSSKADGVDIYVAEDCSPNVSVGQHVDTNTVICHMYGGGNGIETGWANPNQQQNPLSYVYGGNGSGCVTALGANYGQFLHALGAPYGIREGNDCGFLPSGWPSW